MIVLCGFPVSNYYNKVKMVLLEKGVAFTEERVAAGSKDEAVLTASPLGKVPFIRTEHGNLCESQVIADYLEAAYPDPPLLPKDAWQAAKVHELVAFVELHLELVARQLYPKAYFGGELADDDAERIRRQLVKNIAGFKRLVRFGPYLAGETFGLADCAGWVSLPLIATATKTVLGEDLLITGGIDWKPYHQSIGERPSAQRVAADRKADLARTAPAN